MKKLTKFINPKFFLFLIIILALFLRFFKIQQAPPSLNWDEISHGYNAYSILKTGKDEWGKSFPLIFRAYGDYKLPVYIYLTSVSVFFFGLNAFSVRFVSVLAGVGSVIFTYLLVREIFKKSKNEVVPLISSFLVAIAPWPLFLSRAAFEANLALFFIISGIYFLLKGLVKPKIFNLAVFFLGLSVWTYNSARVFVPLLIFSFALIYRKKLLKLFKKDKKIFIAPLILGIVMFGTMFVQLIRPEGQARYGWVSIVDEGAVLSINEARRVSTLPRFLNIAVNNKATYFLKEFTKNYVSHFSYNFLFKNGGTNYQFSVPSWGLIYKINLLFILIGLFSLLKKKEKGSWFLLTWILLSPIASSITREAPHVLRSIVMIPVPFIFSAFGVGFVYDLIKKKFKSVGVSFLVFYLLLIGFCGFKYFKNYFNVYSKEYAWSWQYGYSQVAGYVERNYDNFDKIIISKKYGEPHEFLLFYLKVNPKRYYNDPNLIRFFQSNWYWVDRFDKFYFVNDWDIPNEGKTFKLESGSNVLCDHSCLLITSPGNAPSGWKKIYTVDYPNGDGAFEMYKN